MNKISVVLRIRELEYEEALARGIGIYGHGLLVKILHGNDKNYNKSIIITDCDVNKIISENTNDEPVLFLAEDDSELALLKEKGVKVTYKYQSIINIITEIHVLASECLGENIGAFRNVVSSKIITFSSASGGVGTTTLSLATAQFLKRYRSEASLYISLEQWESTDKYMKIRNESRNIEEFLYNMKERKKAAENPAAFMCKDYYNVNAFEPANGINPLCMLDSSDMGDFIDFISKYGKYEYIIIDIGCRLDATVIAVMESSIKNVFVSDSLVIDVKEQHFLNYIKQNTSIDTENNFIRAVNRQKAFDTEDIFHSADNKEDNDKHKNQFIIYEDPESFRFEDGVIKIDLDCDFGTGISEMASAL